MLRHAAKDQFAESRVTVGTCNDQTGTDLAYDFVQLSGCVSAPVDFRRALGSQNAVV
jgi:hypothetical protein